MGSNFHLLSESGETVTVTPFSDQLPSVNGISIGTGVTAYDASDGSTYLLGVGKGLYFGPAMDHSLACPNQLRYNGVEVNDVPRQFDPTSSHSIHLSDPELTIPLQLKGPFSIFHTRYPSDLELETLTIYWLTPEDDDWNPHDARLDTREQVMEHRQNAYVQDFMHAQRNLASLSLLHDMARPFELEHLHETYPTCPTHTAASLQSDRPAPSIDAPTLAKNWGIGLSKANETLQVTTQRGIRTITPRGDRRFRTRQSHLRYNLLDTKFYGDSLFVSVKSAHGHVGSEIFVSDFGYKLTFPFTSKAEIPDKIDDLVRAVGIPKEIVTDGAGEQTGRVWAAQLRKYKIWGTLTEPHSPWQNRAEIAIRELKFATRRLLSRTQAPLRLWDYALQWVAEVQTRTANSTYCQGRTPYEVLHGHEPDISEFAHFHWYQPVHYVDSLTDFPEPRRKLGRLLGRAQHVGQALTYFILTPTAQIIARSSVWSLSPLDQQSPDYTSELTALDTAIKARFATKKDEDLSPSAFPNLEEDAELPYDGGEYDPLSPDQQRPDADDYTPEEMDEYLNAQVSLPRGEDKQFGTVVRRKRNRDDQPIGTRNTNPLLDTRLYEVQFPDGTYDTYAANLIAENIYSQIDSEGRHHTLMQDITDHRSDETAVTIEQAKPGSRSTRGWQLLIEWKDGTTSWERLADVKESFPIEVAEYAKGNGIHTEPAFRWWVPHVLRKRNRIISKVKAKYWKRTHKFGIEVPKSVKEALAIDAASGTDFWRKAIEKEMRNVMIAFEFNEGDSTPVGHKRINLHMIFDVKMDLTRKARLVANGNETEAPKSMVYSSVVSRDSVRLALLIAALNDLEVMACDIQNAYLNASTKEKLYCIAGDEFGTNAGRPAKIVRALYGLTSSAQAWRSHLAQTLRDAGFTSCLADPDVWMRASTHSNGAQYYEYILTYVDDILAISEHPNKLMELLKNTYKLKPESIGKPDTYLGAQIEEWTVPGGTKACWSMSSHKYVKNAVREVNQKLHEIGRELNPKVDSPLTAGYRPEMDLTPELDAERTTYFQELIGILRWICELGRVDIVLAVALLSSQLAMPREGHLEQAFRIFAYLDRYDRSHLVFDPSQPNIDEQRFTTADWTEFYTGAEEAKPPNAPKPLGRPVVVNCFVDADHAGCKLTRRSHTGVIIYVNRAPILWYSKRQRTVEASSFGSEFCAMRIGLEMIEGLRYKLRMMGVPIDGSANVFCDNQSVCNNTTRPESVLNKKHNAINYHRIREACAAGTIRVAKEPTGTNVSDLLTKALPAFRLRDLIRRILW